MFTVIPAIDLRAGSVVRLTKGEIGTETTYYKQPVEALKHWMALGARTIHVVDLDAAAGIGNNQAAVKDLVDAAGSKVAIQVGGGVRSVDTADGYLAMGVERVVVSTAAVKKPSMVRQISSKHGPGSIIVALDHRNEKVQVKGWTEDSGKDIYEMGKIMEANGAGSILLSSVEADGAFAGPDLGATSKMVKAVGIPVLAAGGTRNLGDISNLREAGAAGVVIGKALYEGKIDLAAALMLGVP
ncbi:MAG: 1-(5-phosphoribosyl)-5-[(5-phosphoribosylamino)methylideneamino]imidazole-4-carboxamide isomerase [Candidatus Lokiarchaeota archaeon]|nr:1-(5-phosphoribosyl)-5-[(5-phosphoribosylamino)methylideneamino]imidazole-4-carboxamide isomerase [Candidatus Lokiarchaeota archaeon]